MKRALFLFVIILIFITNISLASSKSPLSPDELVEKMRTCFEKTLINNYGNHSMPELYNMFFESFYQNNGDYILETDREEIKEINKNLFLDSFYFQFYPKVVNVSSRDSILIIRNKCKEKGDSILMISYNKNENLRTHGRRKFNTYYSWGGYVEKKLLNVNSGSEVLLEIDTLRQYLGNEQNMFELVDLIKEHPEEIHIEELKDFVVIIFWKYMCYCSNYDMVERKKVGKYDKF